MTPESENLLRAARFEKPDRIPMRFGISAACWDHYPQDALQDLMASHPLLFPNFQRSDTPVQPTYALWRRKDKPHRDSWGCLWETNADGVTGTVVRRPLDTWEAFEAYIPPDPEEEGGWGPMDWSAIAQGLERTRASGRLARGSLRHGHTFLTLTYLRGYENLLFDMADEEPRLTELIEMVGAFNLAIVRCYIKLGVEWMGYPEDLGMQRGPMLSPGHFRQYIKPVYRRLMRPAERSGCVIHMHSDGDIRALAADLLDCGVQVLNLQDLVNDIDWIRGNLKGKVCIDLDIDRQRITRFGTPAQIDALILEAVEKLGSREGGLMLSHGLFPGIPLENVRALMDAMERYATHYRG